MQPLGKALSDAYIEIYSDQDVFSISRKTDGDGKLIVDKLDYGKYYLKEVKAPNGYAISLEKSILKLMRTDKLFLLH